MAPPREFARGYCVTVPTIVGESVVAQNADKVERARTTARDQQRRVHGERVVAVIEQRAAG
jgi:hypothetical protein